MKSRIPSFSVRRLVGFGVALSFAANLIAAEKAEPAAKAKKPADGGASITIEGHFPGTEPKEKEPKLIYTAEIQSQVSVKEDGIAQRDAIKVTVAQGTLKELVLKLGGDGEISEIQGKGRGDWGILKDSQRTRSLVIRTLERFQTNSVWTFVIESNRKALSLPATHSPLNYAPVDAATSSGFLRVETVSSRVAVDVAAKSGLTVIDPASYRGLIQRKQSADTADPLAFHFASAGWSLKLKLAEADPDARKIRVKDFQLTGEIAGDAAAFTLTGKVRVNHPEGGELDLLGAVALKRFAEYPNVSLNWSGTRYVLKFARAGEFPIDLEFDAQVTDNGSLKQVSFDPPAAALRPVSVKGLPAGTQLFMPGAAEPERKGDAFVSHLAAAGPLTLQWQPAREKVESRLFYSVEGLSQIVVSPGLIRQTQVMDYKVMQGEMTSLKLSLAGAGEVTRVHCDGILSWKVEGTGDANVRTLTVQLNQAKNDALMLTIQSEQALGAFPLTARPMRAVPDGAIRYGGHLRVVNSGAVRLEVVNASGLVQVSPQRFPQNQILGQPGPQQKPQAWRFSGADFDLEISADNILPELTVSELLVYHLGETESRIEAELELEIREAPLREFAIGIPADYSVSQLSAPQLGNYDVETTAAGVTELRLQFSKPLIGRQVMSVTLTHNHDAPEAAWALPPVRPLQVKSVRGFVGVSADAGLRLAEGEIAGVSEIATAFFPKKIAELQLAWRIREATWTAGVASERLALSIQADALQLFSVGKGITYGSAVINYLISGAPVSKLSVIAPTNYANVEFTGREVRNWRATTNGFEIELHTPVSGAYTLLATYDLQFDPQGAELDFIGMEPADVQSEQGHVIVVSANQFTTTETAISPGLIHLETGEIPAEYRLLFDAPILKAYQYTSRPFQARLKLTSLNEGKTVEQVVDRATFETKISGEGQELTVARYFVKSVGRSHLRLNLPPNAKIWSSTVNGKEAVLVKDGDATLVPLPQNVAPNTVIPVELKLGVASEKGGSVKLRLPTVDASALLAEWTIEPDAGRRLVHQGGNVLPEAGTANSDISGFAWLLALLDGYWGGDRGTLPWIAVALLIFGAVVWRWGTAEGARRYDGRNIVCVLTGGGACGLGVMSLIMLLGWSASAGWQLQPSIGLSYTIPALTPDSAVAVELQNLETDKIGLAWLRAWPILLGFVAWFYALGREAGAGRSLLVSAGWASHGWGALRLPNGAWLFFLVVLAFLLFHLLIPLLRRQLDLPSKPRDPDPTGGDDGSKDSPGGPASPDSSAPAAGAVALLLLAQLVCPGDADAAKQPESVATPAYVTQQAKVVKNDVFVSAKMEWTAKAGDRLDFLQAPAVLTQISFSTNIVKLAQETLGKRPVYRLQATQPGKTTIEFDYQIPVENRKGTLGFALPNHFGLVSKLTLDIDRADVEIQRANVVSVKVLKGDAGRSLFELALTPSGGTRIEWNPRTRDTSEEKTVFFAEMRQFYVPTAGVIEGSHDAQIRPAQGQVGELVFTTPEQLTITDVAAEGLRSWRFDPDTRKLRVDFSPPLAKPFVVRIHSQISTSPLPYQRKVGLISVEGAAREIGLVGVATGSDVQLGEVTAATLSRINLEDFPNDLIAEAAKQVSGLTLRRAFRYADAMATIGLSADAVEPDIRVLSRQNLLLSEDRVVLGANLTVNITRAGVFNLSFALPAGMDVESLTGEALSHWTELMANGQRIVKLHLNGKTEGQIAFAVSLVGSGTAGKANVAAPRLSLIEADKEAGQLIVSPEQGMRLLFEDREGVMQLDPKKEGINQRGVLAFRLLQSDWKLGFAIEKIPSWVEVESLQDVTIREGQLKATVYLHYKIKSAGLKSLFVSLPANADSVRFSGDHVADFVKSADAAGDSVEWEVKLRRRVIDDYRLRVNFQVATPDQPTRQLVAGVRADRVNLQGAHLTVRAGGRLQVDAPAIPGELQKADWQSVPVGLRREAGPTGGSFTFRAIDPDYRLTVNVARHEAAALLPSRVENVELASLVSDTGTTLTETRITLHPGDSRSLRVKMPAGAEFWFAFVDGVSSRPWREGEFILIPFDSPAEKGAPVRIEFFYSNASTPGKRGTFDLGLLGPVFDLPLQNIRWNVFLPPNWKLEEEDEVMRLEEAQYAGGGKIDVASYVQSQTEWQQQQMQDAERMLAVGNKSLQEGNQRNALQSFKSAMNLSRHDDAFNEDARVQLHNLKLQQALVGLNNRANTAFAEQPGQAKNTVAIQAEGQELRYTNQQAEEALNRNPAEAYAALMKLAEQLVKQQEAAHANPDAIQAALPEYGQRLTFTQSMIVNEGESELQLNLEVSEESGSTNGKRFGLLFATLAMFALLMALGRRKPAEGWE